MIELLYFIFVVIVSTALGHRILRLIGLRFEKNLESFIFSMPLGLAAIAYITFFIGIAGFLYKSVLIVFLAALFLLFFREIKEAMKIFFGFIKKINLSKIKKKCEIGFNFFTLAIGFLIFLVIGNFIGTFVPPWHFDVLAYNLAVPKVYIRAHQIVYMPDNFYSNLPSLVNTIYLMGLLLHSGVLSNMLGYVLGVNLVLAIFYFCSRFFNFKIAVLSSLIFYSFPNVIRLSRTSHVDIQLASFIFLAFYGLFIYLDSGSNKHLVMSGIFAGLGASSKIFGIVGVCGISVILLSDIISRLLKKELNYKKALLKLFIFFLVVLIIFSPWLLKNYIFTGNPVWPAMNGVFNGKYWDKEHQEQVAKLTLKRVPSIINFLRLPWDIHTQTGSRIPIENIDYEESIGPYFLVFLPLYFILKKKNKVINKFFVLILVSVSIWFFLSYVLRYIIFVWPLIAIISAYVIVELLKNPQISKIVKILLVFTFCFNIAVWAAMNLKSLPVAFGLETHDEFLSRYPGSVYKASKFINANLPEDSKILLFRDKRGFYLDRNYLWADPLFQDYIDYSKIKNEDYYYNLLKSIGITHVLVNTEFEWRGQIAYEHRYSQRILNMMDRFLKKYTKNLYNNYGILVNELR